MERARYLVEAVVLGGESPNKLARSHGVSRSWLFELLRRYREGGWPAIEPRSRRPHTFATSSSTRTASTSGWVDGWPVHDVLKHQSGMS